MLSISIYHRVFGFRVERLSLLLVHTLFVSRLLEESSTYTERFLSSLMALISIFLLPMIAATVSQFNSRPRDSMDVTRHKVLNTRGLGPSTEEEIEAETWECSNAAGIPDFLFGCN